VVFFIAAEGLSRPRFARGHWMFRFAARNNAEMGPHGIYTRRLSGMLIGENMDQPKEFESYNHPFDSTKGAVRNEIEGNGR
jgi:hypothetical protein